MYKQIPPQDLNSLHEVREQEVFKELVVSMAENGWQGRPLLVIDCEDKYVAWTGSHRIAAARKVGLLEVPCYVVSEHELLPHGVEAARLATWDGALTAAKEELRIQESVGDETLTTFTRHGDVYYSFAYNGGLLYHGPGGGEVFAVTLESNPLWSIHT